MSCWRTWNRCWWCSRIQPGAGVVSNVNNSSGSSSAYSWKKGIIVRPTDWHTSRLTRRFFKVSHESNILMQFVLSEYIYIFQNVIFFSRWLSVNNWLIINRSSPSFSPAVISNYQFSKYFDSWSRIWNFLPIVIFHRCLSRAKTSFYCVPPSKICHRPFLRFFNKWHGTSSWIAESEFYWCQWFYSFWKSWFSIVLRL